MSALPFIRNLISVKGDQGVQAALEAIVRWDPAGASEAQLLTMDQNLDVIGKQVEAARTSYEDEVKQLQAIEALSHQRMSAADLLQKQMDAETDSAKKATLQGSLQTLVTMLEEITPDLEQHRKDAQEAHDFLTALETNYNEAAAKLRTAKADLDRARREMGMAAHEREAAERRAAQAREASGLVHSTNSLNVALQAMHEAATKDKEAAAAANRKAAVLTPSSPEKDDPNIAAAMAAASGSSKPQSSLADRLAALKAKQS